MNLFRMEKDSYDVRGGRLQSLYSRLQLISFHGSACGPVIIPVFKTGGRRVFPSPVRSTRTRFRQNLGDRSCLPHGYYVRSGFFCV
jgi:hypothetical protein